MSPFVSVVTVSLNAASTIEDAIASVCLQEVDFAYELICVDGGSTDTTRAIIDRWAARSGRVTRVYEPDNGAFDAMNKGLRAARGQYVLFLNADDFLVSARTLVTAMADLRPGASDNPDLIVGDVGMGRLGRSGVWRHRRVPRRLGRIRASGLYPPHQGQFTKRDLLNAVGGFVPALRFSADLVQYYELERRFRLTTRIVDRDVAFMRAGGISNAGLGAMYRGSGELYRQLRLSHSALAAARMVTVKTLQSLSGIRVGRCPHGRWFAAALEATPAGASGQHPRSSLDGCRDGNS